MDLELQYIDSEMRNSGSIVCLSKRTIATVFECVLSCIILISSIYFLLLVLGLSAASPKINQLFLIVGYISTISLVSAPLGLYGSERDAYCPLFAFVLIASYHLYSLIVYFWFAVRASKVTASDYSFELLHHITVGSYLSLVGLSLLIALLKIVSNVKQIESARVIVVDNNPLD